MKQIIIGVGMVLLLGAGCQKENLVAPDISNKLLVTPVSLSELGSNPAFNTLLSKAALKTGLYKAEDDAIAEEAANYTVLTSRISKAEFLTYEAYSFLIANPNQPAFTFDNYVIRKNHDGSVEEFILRYSYDMDAYLAQGEKRFSAITRYDTGYKLVATNAQEAEALKNGVPALKSTCEVTITVYHETPDDGNYEWEPGAVCQHTTEGDMCNVVIEYSMFCYGGGGGNDTEAPAPGGGSPDYGAPAEGGMLPDNGGPGNPVSVMEPPLGMEGEVISITCPPAVNELNLALDNSLSALQLYWLTNNAEATQQLNDLLAEYDYSEEAKSATLMSITSLMNNNIEGPYDANYYNQIDAYTQADLTNPNMNIRWAAHFAAQCAMLKAQNPTWSMAKVYWEATREMIHLALDIGGLVPVLGEVCDIANGIIYAIEGDGVNAALSVGAAIPFAGWFATGAKFGYKGPWKLVVKSGDVIDFGTRNSRKFREALGLIPGDGKHAHHIIPWDFRESSELVQKAAKSKDAFHINEVLNGIPLPSTNHLTGHNLYNTKVVGVLEVLNTVATSNDNAYNLLEGFINHIDNIITNNPNMNLGQIADLINYP